MSESKPKPWGCAHYAVVACLCFALFLYVAWLCLFRSVSLKISPETTYITEPLDATGKWVDYFHALELKNYPPEMKTDDNGVRIMIRALGIGEKTDPEFARIYYEKLGLDPTVPPTHFFLDQYGYLYHAKTLLPQAYEAQKKKEYDKYVKKTLDDFRADPSHSEEDKERWIREWESRQAASPTEEGDPSGMDGMSMGGMGSMSGLPDDYATWTFQCDLNTSWTIEENPLFELWLNECSPALDIIAEAVRKPVFAFPRARLRDDAPFAMLNMFLPDIQAMRSYARALSARANYRIAQGDFDGAFDDIITCLLLGRRCGHGGMLVAGLAGIAIEGIANAIDFQFPGGKQPTAEQLRRLLDEIDRLPPRVTVEAQLEMERFFALDTVQSIVRGIKTGVFESGGIIEGGPVENILTSVLAVVGTDWNIVFRHINRMYDELEAGTLDVQGFNVPENFRKRPHAVLTLSSRSEMVANVFEALLLPAAEAARKAWQRCECSFNMKRLTLAMLLYEKEHGTLPPTFTTDAAGRPLHSWRVLLLPYLGEEAKKLYDNIRLDEKWDSEHNKQFHETSLEAFQCPSATNLAGGTHYGVIVGSETLFGTDGTGRSSSAYKRHMFMIAERKDAICWMRPDDEIPQTSAELGINKTWTLGSFHTGGANFATNAGGILFISETFTGQNLRAWIVGTDDELP